MHGLVRVRDVAVQLRLTDSLRREAERPWVGVTRLFLGGCEINRAAIQPAGGARLEPRELRARCRRLASALSKRGIGVGDTVAMFEHAYYSVISPEGCAAILWKSAEHARTAAKALKFTAKDLKKLKLVDEILKEPLGGAHRDPAAAAATLEKYITDMLRDLKRVRTDTLLKRRYKRLRELGSFFTVEGTGQWLGSWTPWYGFARLPSSVAYRLPAATRIVAEIHYRAGDASTSELGTLGLFFTDTAPRITMDMDVTLDARAGRGSTVRAQTTVPSDTYAVALWPEHVAGLKGVEVSARTRDGATDVLLFAKDPPAEWPTPYIFKKPVLLRAGTSLVVTGTFDGAPRPLRLRVSR